MPHAACTPAMTLRAVLELELGHLGGISLAMLRRVPVIPHTYLDRVFLDAMLPSGSSGVPARGDTTLQFNCMLHHTLVH